MQDLTEISFIVLEWDSFRSTDTNPSLLKFGKIALYKDIIVNSFEDQKMTRHYAGEHDWNTRPTSTTSATVWYFTATANSQASLYTRINNKNEMCATIEYTGCQGKAEDGPSMAVLIGWMASVMTSNPNHDSSMPLTTASYLSSCSSAKYTEVQYDPVAPLTLLTHNHLSF